MSLKHVMDALIGSPAQNAVSSMFPGGGTVSTISGSSLLSQMAQQQRVASNKKLFHGLVEVLQVANGYIINIGRREGYEFETHIAATITEVNEIIAAQIVAFKLEDKS